MMTSYIKRTTTKEPSMKDFIRLFCVLIFFFAHINAMAGELSYTCEVMHIYKPANDGSLTTSHFEKQMKGSSFLVSRITGKIVGEVIPTIMAKSTKVINKGSDKNSFKAVADFGNQFQILEVQEFHKGFLKPFVSSSMGGAGIVTGMCIGNAGQIPSEGDGKSIKSDSVTESANKETTELLSQDAEALFRLDPFVVNLAKSDGKRFLKVVIYLGMDASEVQAEVKKNIHLVTNSIIILLSSKSFEDVYSRQGKLKLKREIVNQANKFLGGHVKDAYFTEFIIQ